MKTRLGLLIGLAGVAVVSASTAIPALASTQSSHSTVSASAIRTLLPKGAHLIPFNKKGYLVLPVDMNGDGQKEYAALYKYSNTKATNLIGAIIAGERDGKLHKLWQYCGNIGLVAPASLIVKDLLHNNRREVVFAGEVGAMANQVEVLAWSNNQVKPIFQTQAYRVDFGQYINGGTDEIASWLLDTGFLANVQMYGWNPSKDQFAPLSNTETPKYFSSVVVPYYTKLAESTAGKSAPKMIAYGLASAYFDIGQYQLALQQIDKGLKMSANAYPPNSRFVALKAQIESRFGNSTNSISSVPNTSQNATSSTPSTQKNTSPTTPSNVIVHSYASVSQATNAIDAIQQGFGQIYPSGPNLNLGNGISAEQDGALGSLYLKWTEGRWTILAHLASSGAVTQAKQMVSYLHTHMLPAPQNKGVISVTQSPQTLYTRTTVAWQVGTKVYEIQQTGDPVTALKTVVGGTVNQTTTAPAPTSNSTNSTSGTQGKATSTGDSSASITSTSQETQSVSPFPTIVNMAMKQFPANVLNHPEAPTVLPISDSGSNEMYYRTSITTAPILSYQVILSSPHNLLAAFSGSTYSGIPSGDAINLPDGIPTNGHVTSSRVHLSDGIVAKEQIFVVPGPSAQETSSNNLTWNEGRWQIEVSNTQGTKVPMAEANAVASYLHTHFMPIPQTKGAIFVGVAPGENAQGQLSGTSVTETITWQEGSHVYEVDTYSPVKNPIQTGLAMAISMEPYHNNDGSQDSQKSGASSVTTK